MIAPRPPLFDPKAQPWRPAGAGLSALAQERLTPAFLRQALAAPPASFAGDPNYEAGLRLPGREGPWVDAAVLIPLVMHGDTLGPSAKPSRKAGAADRDGLQGANRSNNRSYCEDLQRRRPPEPADACGAMGFAEGPLQVLLTQRAAHLSEHAGQICFPGGRIESRDASAEAGALREAQEETGLAPEYVEVLGRLPVYRTVSGFSVTPVVGLVRPGFALAPDSAEVADVFETPLAFLMNPARHRLHHAVLADGQTRHFYSIPWQDRFIWGATAAMLRSLYHVLRSAY